MHWSIVWIGYLLSWGLIPFILIRNKPPVSTLAWVWSVILFPYIGPIAFLVFGTDRVVRKRLRAGRELSAASARGEKQITPKTRALMEQLSQAERDTVNLLSRLNDIAVTSAENVR